MKNSSRKVYFGGGGRLGFLDQTGFDTTATNDNVEKCCLYNMISKKNDLVWIVMYEIKCIDYLIV